MKSKIALSALVVMLATPVIAQTSGGSAAGTGSGGANDPSTLNKSDNRQGDHDRKSRKQNEGKNPTGAERPYGSGGASGGSAAGTGSASDNDPSSVSKPKDGRMGKQRDPESSTGTSHSR